MKLIDVREVVEIQNTFEKLPQIEETSPVLSKKIRTTTDFLPVEQEI